MKNKISGTISIHPVLFGFYPVLALYVLNRNELVFSAIQQALIASFVVMTIVIVFFILLFKSWQRAALHSSFSLLLLFSYGHIFDLVKNISVFGMSVGHRNFLPFWILLFISGQLLLALINSTDNVNRSLDSISLFLMFFLSVQVLGSTIQARAAEKEFAQRVTASQNLSLSDGTDRDVYYILVDSYSRSDLLQQEVHLDTSDFIVELKKLGFYIPECAQSNYDQTQQSLTTSLNMDYLDALGVDYLSDKARFRPSIQKNLVMERFEALGYSTVTFRSLYPWMDIQDVTYYYDYFKDSSALGSQASLNFQYLFLRTTFVRPLVQYLESHPDITLSPFWSKWIPVANTLNSRDYHQYQQNVYSLESLQKTPDLPGKVFVYAHLFVTHQPFVFYPDGRFHPFLSQDYNAYRDQVDFLNKRLLEIVKEIQAKSDSAPIIVIQADHSYFHRADRVKILNAYYLPEGGDKNLYATVTPVNTFRIIFNTYFGENYELLPDVSLYLNQEKVLQEAPSTCISSPSGFLISPAGAPVPKENPDFQ